MSLAEDTANLPAPVLLLGGPGSPGRAPKAVSHEYAGDLNAADIALLRATREAVKPNMPTRMRQRHHTLAKAVACGLSNGEAAVATGYDPVYISNMRANPTFQLLVHHYEEVAKNAFVDAKDRMAQTTVEIVNLIQERLEAEGDTTDLGTLGALLKTIADRAGFAPVSRTQATVTHIDISAAMRSKRLQRLEQDEANAR